MSIETSKPGTDVDRHPVPDPGLEEHVERYTDVDQAAGDRAYRQVVMMLDNEIMPAAQQALYVRQGLFEFNPHRWGIFPVSFGDMQIGDVMLA